MRKFIYGPGFDEPICMIDVADSNTVYYYHFDGLGSVIALSDKNADLVESYSYDVFGKPSNTSDVNNPYMFTGRRYDNETGLYYYRARYYDYATGRFLQTDPVGYTAGLNLYAYCGNNPVNWLDPKGLTWQETTSMFYLWASGEGPEELLFGPGSNQVEDMKNAPGVNEAREQFYLENIDNILSGEPLDNPEPYQDAFGPIRFLQAGLNPTQHFIGGYSVEITPNPDGTITFELSNTTSMTSFTRYFQYLSFDPTFSQPWYSPFKIPLSPLPSWNQSTFGPGGNMKQKYTWQEPNLMYMYSPPSKSYKQCKK